MLEFELGLFQDLDARGVEIGQQILELAPGRKIRQQLAHFVVKNESFFFAVFHELFHATVFFFSTHWHPNNQRSTRSNSVYNRTISPLPRPLHDSEPFKIVQLLREAERFRQISAAFSVLDKTLQVGSP